jgi:hypothetical protein
MTQTKQSLSSSLADGWMMLNVHVSSLVHGKNHGQKIRIFMVSSV